MFTGIISNVGRILRTEERGDLRVVVGCAYPMEEVALGASIACSGVCLTVVDKSAPAQEPAWFAVDVSAETRACTSPELWREGRALNLERALRLGDELGGHIVTGHVDGLGSVVEVQAEGDSTRLTIAVDEALAPYLAAKGSVTVDGVSLTVNEVADEGNRARFGLNIIPHTAAVTTLGLVKPGDDLNIEIDVLARYLARMQQRLARAADQV